MKSRFVRLPAICTLLATLGACVSTGAGGAWTCSAPGLQNAHYTGGDTALIHLQGYSSGNNYRVTKSADGKMVTGTTGNGTAFQCMAKS